VPAVKPFQLRVTLPLSPVVPDAGATTSMFPAEVGGIAQLNFSPAEPFPPSRLQRPFRGRQAEELRRVRGIDLQHLSFSTERTSGCLRAAAPEHPVSSAAKSLKVKR
jgi:hypothetical protein